MGPMSLQFLPRPVVQYSTAGKIRAERRILENEHSRHAAMARKNLVPAAVALAWDDDTLVHGELTLG